MRNKFNKIMLAMLVATSVTSCMKANETNPVTTKSEAVYQNPYEQEARQKIDVLQNKMSIATKNGLDVTREETTLWFANEFLKFANWDENHVDQVEYLFGEYQPYKKDKRKLAEEIPDFQRKMVLEILDDSLSELDKVINGEIKRRPVNKVDWQNIKIGKNQLTNSNNRPIFLYDYFSKSVGRPLTDKSVYNDHLGAIYHGGENLYPVDHDRAINSFLIKEDGTFDQKLLKELTDIPDTNVGFLVYWKMGIPQWIQEREPEVRMGRSLFTGFDIDNPLARQVWSEIAEKTGELTRDKKVSQLGYILSNEPHWVAISSSWTRMTGEMQNVSSYTRDNYKNWLRNEYQNNIVELNKNWKTSFQSFDEIKLELPISKDILGTPEFYDFARFNVHRSNSWFTFLQDSLRRGNPDAETSIKLVPRFFTENDRSHGIDIEALIELTSIIGDDAKTRESRKNFKTKPEEWEADYAYAWAELGMSYDFMESVAPNKLHLNSESHFLSASNWRKLDTSIEYVESVYWLSTLLGMDANLAWFWARDPDGSPEDRLEGELNFEDNALAGSFAGSVNQQPHIANAYTQVMYDLNSFSEEVIALREQQRPLRLFHSETSAINKKNHMTQQFSMYEKLFFDGFPMGFVTENIFKKQDNSQWEAVLVYKTEFVTLEELNALQNYLDSGGTVIVDGPNSLRKDEYGNTHDLSLNSGNGKLVVLNGKHTLDEIKQVSLTHIDHVLPDVQLEQNNGTDKKGVHWRVVKGQDGKYLLSMLNIGKNTANISLSLKNNSSFTVTNMFTGQPEKTSLVMEPMGVSLFELVPKR